MSDIIEVMARAMHEARARHFGEIPPPCPDDERYELYESYVRGAIDALTAAGYEIVRKDTRSATDAWRAKASGIFHERDDFDGR